MTGRGYLIQKNKDIVFTLSHSPNLACVMTAELGRLNCPQYAQKGYLLDPSCGSSHHLSGRVEEEGDCKLEARHRRHLGQAVP